MEKYSIYFLIAENKQKTYLGFTHNIIDRIAYHKAGKVKSTKNFKNFTYCLVEQVDGIILARTREKYWKSAAGRKKLKQLYLSQIK